MTLEQVNSSPNGQSGARQHAVALGLLSAALVARDDELAAEIIFDLRDQGLERRAVSEIVLQSYLHDGYATALEGMALLENTWPSAEADGPPGELETYAKWETWQERGREHFDRIYGEVASRVLEGAREASPELALWMIVEGYGKVLSRSGVDPATRELATVAVLAMKQRPRQLYSHLRGGLRVGVTAEEFESLFTAMEATLERGEEAGSARSQLARLL